MPTGLRAAVSRHFRFGASARFLLVAPVAAALSLSACGGGGGDDIDMIEAFQVLGQPDFESVFANEGNASPDAGTLAQPRGNIATNGEALFVADFGNNRVLGYNSIPSSNGADADFILGQSSATGSTSGTSQSKLSQPSSVYVGNGYLVVADSGNNRVLIWNSIPTSAGELPDVVVGQTDFNSRTSATTQSGLFYPTAAIIAGNQLIVADQNNNRVLIWTDVPTADGEPADLVLGQSDFVTRVDDDEADEMDHPFSVWSDGSQLLVSDSGNHRVLVWSQLPQNSGEEADYVIGQSDFGRSTAGTSAATLRNPFGITSNGTSVWIADSGNNRVLKFGSFPIANGVSADEVYGQDEDDFTASTANDSNQDGRFDDDDTPDETTLSSPTGVYASNGVLYVSDRGNNRILFFPQ